MTDQGDKDFDRFDDVFHQYGDDIDEDQDKTADFDHLYVNMNKGNNDDFIAAQLCDLENDPVIEIQTEEEHLSQKLSQLSASGKTKDKFSNEPTTTAKKRLAITPSAATATTTFATTLLSSSGSTRKKLRTNEEGNEQGNEEEREAGKEEEEEEDDENKNEDLDDK
ncbi:unnamed protein product [Rotaria magnacalcarata]|uniref:Uncharacterized protein n=2 Tax=Rotaria magnacalcarata TaxID=392030 RepID=A0A815GN92_9BILA|nr:unnamed protein product [Rotaria magnacalcarata]CAF1342267.1 unnamed protein product [Rotaria magnacalcarata]CAF4545229.1 unnamed protein product [Rotaria magnacalcarata]CAF4839990.1 unnamed protein product [Rotaria magnacalcarata]